MESETSAKGTVPSPRVLGRACQAQVDHMWTLKLDLYLHAADCCMAYLSPVIQSDCAFFFDFPRFRFVLPLQPGMWYSIPFPASPVMEATLFSLVLSCLKMMPQICTNWVGFTTELLIPLLGGIQHRRITWRRSKRAAIYMETIRGWGK